MKREDTNERLQKSSECLDRRDPDAAAFLLAPLLERKPSSEALFLMGAARHMQGRTADAEELYRRSLTLNSEQPKVLTSLGKALAEQAKHRDAIVALQKATKIAPSALEAHLQLAHILLDLRDLPGAERSYRDALRLNPKRIDIKQRLGNLLNDLERSEEAETILREALSENTDPACVVALEFALAVSMARQHRDADALIHFETVRSLDSNAPHVDHNRAMLLQRLYRHEEALDVLKSLVERDPANLGAHHHLNHILYRLGRDEEFLSSYDRAAKRIPNLTAIPLAKARFLLAAERFSEARDSFSRLLQRGMNNHDVMSGLMIAHTRLKDFDAAVSIGEAAIDKFPKDVNIISSVAAAFLEMGEPSQADARVRHALEINPYSQAALSLQGLAWRLLGDERDAILNDYENHIHVFDLAPPEGYNGMSEFNRDLNNYLDRLHPPAREFVDQSLRGGTQTAGNIFGDGHSLVEKLKTRIEEAVRGYINEMPDEPLHPLFGRRTQSFTFSGSWSSRLRRQGFHTNHIHSSGWISSCYYVDVPEIVNDTRSRQGWIQFGKPSFDIGLHEPVRRSIQPKAGQLILFPSYMWHGTAPFLSTADRTTIAFDVVPA